MARGEYEIVVVEDDFSMRVAVERVLVAAGFHPLTFASTEALLATDAAATARCLVLDIHLPGLSGLELQQQLAGAGNAAPVIFITAHDDARTRDRAEALGAVAYLTKPFEGKVFIEAVRRALERADRHDGIEDT